MNKNTWKCKKLLFDMAEFLLRMRYLEKVIFELAVASFYKISNETIKI